MCLSEPWSPHSDISKTHAWCHCIQRDLAHSCSITCLVTDLNWVLFSNYAQQCWATNICSVLMFIKEGKKWSKRAHYSRNNCEYLVQLQISLCICGTLAIWKSGNWLFVRLAYTFNHEDLSMFSDSWLTTFKKRLQTATDITRKMKVERA